MDIRTHNGCITISNPATGNHRTFRIRTQKSDAKFAPGKRVVALLTGPDNNNSYQGFGFAEEHGIRVWEKKRGSVFDTYADMLANQEKWMAKGAVYQNEGCCRVCNKKLTEPKSIELGIGPICRGE